LWSTAHRAVNMSAHAACVLAKSNGHNQDPFPYYKNKSRKALFYLLFSF
jgi:hypothetical protein